MLLDLLGALLGRTDAELGGPLEQPRDDGDRGLVLYEVREFQGCLHDLLVQLHLVVGVAPKREGAHDELMHHDPERPPVDRASVPLALDGLWSKVLGRADQGVSPQRLLAAAEVDKLGVALEIQQDVLGLEVSVYNGTTVEVLECQGNRRAVELRLRLGQLADLANGEEQVTTTEELREKVNVLGVLESLDELHDARVVALGVDVSLDADRFLLPLTHHLLLAHTLQSIQAVLIGFVVHELHDAERTSANDGLQPQILHGDIEVLKLHPVLELTAESAHDLQEH
mmetsp:Transcript_39600/g.103213  ORF Transcript_39600/g.103213 Transcript_39600/m.103213 type:complete len:284 (-) Transcript_39600:459-1310(-)